MIGIYFSGTGNTKYAIEMFVRNIDLAAECISIEQPKVIQAIEESSDIVLAYPVYYSNLPKIMKDFIENNSRIFLGKKVFIIATMGLFSGDGTGCAARLLKKYGAEILGGLHVKMPDCIGDEKLLKKTREENKAIVKQAEQKIKKLALEYKKGAPPQEGISFLCHIAGLFGQRLWFYNKTKYYSDKLKINADKCIGCGICEKLCPMSNLFVENKTAKQSNKCTMCYRCVSHCPNQAITLLGSVVYEQCKIEDYI